MDRATATLYSFRRSRRTMAVEIETSRRRFTAMEFERMAEAGIFGPEERVELIDGEILEMSPIGPGHGSCVTNATKKLILGVGDRAVVWIASSAHMALHSMPQPDLALLQPRSYWTANPRARDVMLIVEVADSSLRFDRTRKLRLYAEAGIPEYWVASVAGEWIEVCRSPQGSAYRDVRRAQRTETIAPLAFPDVVIPLAEIFG